MKNENKPEEEDKQIRIKSTKPEIDENNNNLKSENTTFFISDSRVAEVSTEHIRNFTHERTKHPIG